MFRKLVFWKFNNLISFLFELLKKFYITNNLYSLFIYNNILIYEMFFFFLFKYIYSRYYFKKNKLLLIFFHHFFKRRSLRRKKDFNLLFIFFLFFFKFINSWFLKIYKFSIFYFKYFKNIIKNNFNYYVDFYRYKIFKYFILKLLYQNYIYYSYVYLFNINNLFLYAINRYKLFIGYHYRFCLNFNFLILFQKLLLIKKEFNFFFSKFIFLKKKNEKKIINFRLNYYLIFKYLSILFITRYIYFYNIIKKFNLNILLIEINLLALIEFFKTLLFNFNYIFYFIYNNLFLFDLKKENYFFFCFKVIKSIKKLKKKIKKLKFFEKKKRKVPKKAKLFRFVFFFFLRSWQYRSFFKYYFNNFFKLKLYFRKIYGNLSLNKYKIIIKKLNKFVKFRLNYFFFFFELNIFVILKKLGYKKDFLNVFLKYNLFILLRKNNIVFISNKFFHLQKKDFIFLNFNKLIYLNEKWLKKKKYFFLNNLEYNKNIHSFIILDCILFHNIFYFWKIKSKFKVFIPFFSY